jgi:hypothetical protein
MATSSSVRSLPAHRGRDTPAVALSALSYSREDVLDTGFLVCLSKPVLLQELITGVISAVDSAIP